MVVVDPNVWSHVSVSVDRFSSNVNFYINGTLVSSHTGVDTGVIEMSDSNFIIGNNGGNSYFEGKLDDVAVYRGVLTNNAITSIADTTTNTYYNNPQLIAGYRFDALIGTTVLDESLNSNHGTFVNSVNGLSPSYTPNNVCIDFESNSNQYVVAPMSADSEFNQMTLCAWVNTASGSTRTLVHKDGCFTWSLNGSGNMQLLLKGNNESTLTSTTTIPDNTWTHVAASVDQFNSKVSFFTDGIFSSSNDLVIDVPQTASDLFIGWDSNTTYYNGKMDDVLIYNEALTNDKISTIGDLTTQSSYYIVSDSVSTDTWTHVAATYDKDAGIINLYHNTSNVASYSNYNVDVGSNTNVVTIGKSDTSTYYYGKMDDVRIYDKVLTQSNVSSLYNRYFLSGNGGYAP